MFIKLKIYFLSVICCFVIGTTAYGSLGFDVKNEIISKQLYKQINEVIEEYEKPNSIYSDSIVTQLEHQLISAFDINYYLGQVRLLYLIAYSQFKIGNYTKAIESAEKAFAFAKKYSLKPEQAKCLRLMGIIFNELDGIDKSSDFFFKSLKLYEEIADSSGIAQSLGDIGMNFFSQNEINKSYYYYKKSINIASKINDSLSLKRQFNNIANVYHTRKHFDSAAIYLKKALHINKAFGDKLGQGINLLNIGWGHLNTNSPYEALENFRKADQIFVALNNPYRISECNINIGATYYKLNNFNESRKYLLKALSIAQKENFNRLIFEVGKLLWSLYVSQGDSLGGLKYLLIEKNASDSLNVLNKRMQLTKLELLYSIEKKELEQGMNYQKKKNIVVIILGGLLSIIAILILLYSRHRMKLKYIDAYKDKIEAELEIKGKELTVSLLAQSKNKEVFSLVSNSLEDIRANFSDSNLNDKISRMLKELKILSDEKVSKELNARFKEVHAGFYDKLLAKFPNLTQNELKLCAYLRLNMTTKDIAELTGQSIASIEQARYRLRKRLKLSNSDVNLTSYLTRL